MSSSLPSEGHRTFTISHDDQAGTIVVITTLLMTWSLLCLIIRFHNRLVLSSSIGLDDLACGVSTLFGVVQSIVACSAVSQGFGKSLTLVTVSQVNKVAKYEYANELLCLVAIALSKIAMLFFHLRITPRRAQRVACYALAGVCAAWTVAVLIVAATRCGNDKPALLYGRICDDYDARWLGIVVTDCLLELAIFSIPVWILWDLQTSTSYKITILLSFASRLFVIVASGIHASTILRWSSNSFSPIAAVTPFIWLQVETNYAIMSATFPTLGTVLKAMNTRWGALDGPDVAQYAMESISNSRAGVSRAGVSRRGPRHTRNDTPNSNPKLRPDSNNYTFHVRSPPELVGGASTRKNSDDSEQMIIRKTVSTSVEHQDAL